MNTESWISNIQRAFETGCIYYTQHARQEMEQEEYGITLEYEVAEMVCDSEVLRIYADDRPYPSALIYGRTSSNRPLHIVCAWCAEEETVIVVTAYQPDSELWDAFRKRMPR